jgi:ABC-type bacteriocin/lantibiotic exporter with double-glycine peptidase domain
MLKLPYFKQKTDYTCGPACVRMILANFKIKKPEHILSKELKTSKKRGTLTKELISLFKKYNFQAISHKNSSLGEIKNLLSQNYLIILLHYIPSEKLDHYSIAKKITNTHIFLLDPYLGKNHSYKLKEYSKIWHSDPRFEKKKKWFLAVKHNNP